MSPNEGNNLEETEGEGVFTGRRKLIIIGVTVLVVLALGVGAYLYFSRGEAGILENENANISETTNTKDVPSYSVTINKTTNDTDRDGLKNDEEKEIGTDPEKADTDSDGLSDYEESKVYKSNPKLSDSDGDGFSDGEEVERGFDPNGPGSLLDLKKAIENLNTNQ